MKQSQDATQIVVLASNAARTSISEDAKGAFALCCYSWQAIRKKTTMIKSLRILIVDDQQHARRSLRALLATRFQLVGTCEAVNGIEAIRCVEECKPDIVLMDVRMPRMDGIEATRIIRTKSAQVPVIILSMYGEHQEAALAAGANAFLSKGELPERLLAVLTAAFSAI